MRQGPDDGREHAGDPEVVRPRQCRVADQKRVIGPHRQPGAQRFFHSLRTDTDQSDRTAELLPQAQPSLGRVLIVVVHDQGQAGVVDAAPIRLDPDRRLGVWHLLDADNDIHACPSRRFLAITIRWISDVPS